MEIPPEFYAGSSGLYYNNQNQQQLIMSTPEKQRQFSDSKPPGDHFIIEDLLDFPNDDVIVTEGTALDNVTGTSTDSSAVTVVDSCNSSFSGNEPRFSGNLADPHFSNDLCVPVINSLIYMHINIYTWQFDFIPIINYS